MHLRNFRDFNDPLPVRLEVEAGDVLLDGAVHESHMLRNVTECLGNMPDRKPLDVDAAELDLAACARDAPQYGFGKDGLSRPALSDDLHRRSRLDIQIHGA